MADVVPTPRKQSLQMAGVIAGMALTMNGLFFVMSRMYFADKPALAGDLGSVRAAFAVLTFVVAAMAYLAAVAPRTIGHVLAAAFGVASVVGGVAGLASTLPGVLGATLLVSGVLLPVLAYYSWQFSRPAWAFLIAMLSVLATVTFFGAPKIRHLLDIGLWHAMLIPSLMIVGVIALSMVRDEYKGRT